MVDLFLAYSFIKRLVKPFNKWPAYKLGIIDEKGNILIKRKDFGKNEQKKAFGVFDQMILNIKKLLSKLPGGQTKLASYAAALWLIKEETGMSEKAIIKLMEKYASDNDMELDTSLYESNGWFATEDGRLRSGNYTLAEDIASPKTGEIIARKGTAIKAYEDTAASGSILGANIYMVEHIQTRQQIYVSTSDIL